MGQSFHRLWQSATVRVFHPFRDGSPRRWASDESAGRPRVRRAAITPGTRGTPHLLGFLDIGVESDGTRLQVERGRDRRTEITKREGFFQLVSLLGLERIRNGSLDRYRPAVFDMALDDLLVAQLLGEFCNAADHETQDDDATHRVGEDEALAGVVVGVEITKADGQYGDVAEIQGCKTVNPGT